MNDLMNNKSRTHISFHTNFPIILFLICGITDNQINSIHFNGHFKIVERKLLYNFVYRDHYPNNYPK